MIEATIVERIAEALASLYGYQADPGTFKLEWTNREFAGDFTFVVFPFLKASRKPPEVTAGEIGHYLKEHISWIAGFNVVKGFLNILLSDEYWVKFALKSSADHTYGFHHKRNEKPVVLEYSSPNTNKPLHLGHIRNNLLGFSLAEILKANGYKVVKVNLVNDRGIHICKSMLAYMRWGNDETPASTGMKGDHLVGKYYVLFDQHYRKQMQELILQGLTEEEAGKQAPLIQEAQEILRKWEARDADVMELWNRMNGWVYQGFDETYRRLGVDFDHIYYESNTYLLGKKLVTEGLNSGTLTEKEDGSVWADLREDGLDEKLLLRSDGTSVYMTQDLGTAQLRYDDYHPSRMIYVVGNEQNYHFDVLKLVLARLGKEYASHIVHLSYGMVELPHGKMKSREGTVVDADDLMEEMYRTAEETTRALGKANELTEVEAATLFHTIGLGALKYFILKVDPKKNMLFDPVESIDFNGNTGPFIQYTYARIQSLLEKARLAGHNTVSWQAAPATSLLPPEKETIRRIYQFRETVAQAGEELNPAIVANYVYELAKGFNQLYQELPVLKDPDPEKVMLRLCIASFAGDIIRRSMSLLGIEVPARM